VHYPVSGHSFGVNGPPIIPLARHLATSMAA
jgi:hypothetical protein